MRPFPDFTGLVLDGGRATRMGGRHKAFLEVAEIGGRPIALRTTELFRSLFADVVVAGDRPEPWAALGVRCVPDATAGAGPLAGIAAGLAACSTRFAFVVAGDMPELAQPVIEAICRVARDAGRTAVPRIGGRPEPLHAAYDAARRGEAAAALERGVRKIGDWLATEPVTWIDESELAGLPGFDRTFRNVNEPHDIAT